MKEYKVLQFLLDKSIDEGVDRVDPELIKQCLFKGVEKDYEKCISYLKTKGYIKVHFPFVCGSIGLAEDLKTPVSSGFHVVGKPGISITDDGKAFLHITSTRRRTLKIVIPIVVSVISGIIVFWFNRLLTQ
ncbi:hypothetical protein EEL32_00390 (plasmid) [Brevibacillus laterosporus]|uniref:Uncharacterized protein n=1 Tax=Brevibacillus laterosporus TaxID=1465 RepID=A0A502J3E2_BRELA|nr:hypothetical protein [Brevibacillus laterosporus]MED1787586.1 hypothetical protein [Brevibacillus laterosporus]QDX91108.1 hypothetical protein EEL30_01120 [Brevibacillus laterosporus]TPG93547.1 hypothetical protein EEL32_00390 [Brevibacillus laterosporus]